jgi:hypothetical protein
MAHSGKVAGILVMIDCLLDTRLGTIAKLDTELARKVVSSETYFTREEDRFEGVNDILFKNAYLTRDKSTLTHSVMTAMVSGWLRGMINQLKEQALTGPEHDRVRVDVNIYPYQFSDEEKDELCKVLKFRLDGENADPAFGHLLTVEVIDKPIEQLTPQFCKASYGAMVMYDPWTWMNTHFYPEVFETAIRLPEVLLYAPRIYFDRKPTAAELKEFEMQFRMQASVKPPDQFTCFPHRGNHIGSACVFQQFCTPSCRFGSIRQTYPLYPLAPVTMGSEGYR